MRGLRIAALCIMCVMGANTVAAKEADVLIWGGGKQVADAQRFQRAYRAGFDDIIRALHGVHSAVSGAQVASASGDGRKDRVLASNSLPGLKPGFHILIVSVCEPGNGELAAKKLRPVLAGIYSRRVTVPEDWGLAQCQFIDFTYESRKHHNGLTLTVFSADAVPSPVDDAYPDCRSEVQFVFGTLYRKNRPLDAETSNAIESRKGQCFDGPIDLECVLAGARTGPAWIDIAWGEQWTQVEEGGAPGQRTRRLRFELTADDWISVTVDP